MPLASFGRDDFATYARNWGEAIPRCGADLVGYFAPHEGSATTAYGIYNIENLAAYEAYRARLRADAAGAANFAMAQAKANIHISESLDARTARDFGLEALAVLAATPEWAEGMSAFVEKRQPRFT